MRYVAICEGGSHIQDVPWFMWAHRGSDQGVTEEVRFCRAYDELKYTRASKLGEGLNSLSVSCNKCKRSRSLAELVGNAALLRDGIKCDGHQPWEQLPVATPCEYPLVAVQRGATGNYIAERISALDIPEERPQSEEQESLIRGNVLFDRVVADNGGPMAEQVAGWIAEELDVPVQTVLRLATGEAGAVESRVLELKDGEWAAFVKKLASGRDRSGEDFLVDGHKVVETYRGNSELTRRIAGIGQVRRVREVRALLGFRRHNAQADLMPVDLGANRTRYPTYPAIELFGEGIFIRFDEDVISEWERDPAVQARATILVKRREESDWAQRLDIPEPRFIALHTIAHLMIRQLAFASGYSSASLQERIYANSDRVDRTAGILIYTAAGDAQGTLGGLVRLGGPDALLPLIVAALDNADVCSNDPVCIESDRQGSSQLNLSACHGCSLISETSCEAGNRLLDRQLVLGGSAVPGLLEGVLEQIRAQ